MRIISGTHKGRRLMAPKNLPVRPTTDYAKESLFNILRNSYHLEDLTVLDLCAGTGNISFEFASRGAQNIVAVDAHHGCCKYIDGIAKQLEFSIKTIKSDVFKFLQNHKGKYDIVFADPPYNFTNEQFKSIVDAVFTQDLLAEDGTVVIEHSKHTDLSNVNDFDNSRRYGSSCFSFFIKK